LGIDSKCKEKIGFHPLSHIHQPNYSTVTEWKETTSLPFLTFTFHFKLDKKGNMIKGEYEDFNIEIVEIC